jgi:CHAD domain-containing protein
MEAFLQDTEEANNGDDGDHGGEVPPVQVRHVLGNAIWARYEVVRAYETVMDAPTITQLHMLRITGKYLRYTLEFFREVLPDNASGLIRDVTAMQDQLGALHDADVAAGLARDYLAALSKKGKKKRSEEASANTGAERPTGLTDYINYLQGVVGSTKSDFASTTWQRITGRKWRAQLAAAIAAV